MAKSDKELKPLLDKSSTHQQQQVVQHQQHTTSQKKHTAKGKTSSKPKLFSVSETSVEADVSTKEERRGHCSEKDVDETETQKMKQPKSAQATPTPHPPQQLHSSTGEPLDDGRQVGHTFGVKSYLHHFYESVSQSQTPSQVSYAKILWTNYINLWIVFALYYFSYFEDAWICRSLHSNFNQ